MMKELGVKPLIYPEPVFIIGTYDENNIPNAMNAAWGGIAYDDKLFICMGDNHKTTKNLLFKKELTVSFATKDTVVSSDFVGIKSGLNDIDKIKKTRFTPLKAPHVDAPYFKELPLTIECKVESYDKENCFLLLQIVNVLADDSILDENDKINVKKLNPITYDPSNHKYYDLGEVVGNAFKDGLKLK